MDKNILKIYISNALFGLTFYKSAETFFLLGHGIDAAGIGFGIALLVASNLIFDIPAGLIADRWSRKGALIIGSLSLFACTLVISQVTNNNIYLISIILFSFYKVFTNGTYEALIYSILKASNQTAKQSKIIGRAQSCFFVSLSFTSLMSGFLAAEFGFGLTFILTGLACIANCLVLYSIKEPRFKGKSLSKQPLKKLGKSLQIIKNDSLLRKIVLTMTLVNTIEIFTLDFRQLYVLHYFNLVQIVGIVTALHFIITALSSNFAHHFSHVRLDYILLATTIPAVLIIISDSWINIILLFFQIAASSILRNQAITKIQHATPSTSHSALLSATFCIGRFLGIPFCIIVGWMTKNHGIFIASYSVAAIAILAAIYWYAASYRRQQKNPIEQTS